MTAAARCFIETWPEDGHGIAGDVHIDRLGDGWQWFLGRGTDVVAFLIGCHWMEEDNWNHLDLDPGWENSDDAVWQLEWRLQEAGAFVTEHLEDVETGYFRKTPYTNHPEGWAWHVRPVDGPGHGAFEGMRL